MNKKLYFDFNGLYTLDRHYYTETNTGLRCSKCKVSFNPKITGTTKHWCGVQGKQVKCWSIVKNYINEKE